MWFKMIPRDLSWSKQAAQKITNVVDLSGSPEDVFSILADMKQTPLWFKEIEGGTWDSEATHCVGAKRTIHLDRLSVRETFLSWDLGRRFAFTITESTLPLTVSIVEDYRLIREDNGHTRLEWDVVYQLRWFMIPFKPIVVWVFGGMFRRASASLVSYVAQGDSKI